MAEVPHNIDLTALHFALREDGAFVVPPGSVVTFTPIGQFFELRIVLANSTTVTAVLAKAALKIRHAEATECRDG